MTGHFTSYENRTDHELATPAERGLTGAAGHPILPDHRGGSRHIRG